MSARRWVLTVRAGSRVEHERYATLDETLAALEHRAEALEGQTERQEVRFFTRRIDPAAQVAARLEIAGPWRQGVTGGIDFRGDGSAEAYTGRIRRSLVERRRGESAAAALRRVLQAG